ncbi:MAG: AAA family ATPase [Phycisphaerales bacterium]|nr:AAA family ATPase [Phycisphaerales bacterium]
MSSVRVSELAIRQYKSIENCRIELEPLTILVGRNGAGKSNIIDAIRFVTDALRNTLEYAIRERGGIEQVRRKSLGGRPTHPGVELTLRLPDGGSARYAFRIAAVKGRDFRIDKEACSVTAANGERADFKVEDGNGAWSLNGPMPPVQLDRLMLVALSGYSQFRPVFDVLTRMAFHNLNAEAMKLPQRPEPGTLLAHDGRNLASVIKQMQSASPEALQRVVEYLRVIGVQISRVAHKQAGALETFEVAQEKSRDNGHKNLNFDAIALSDGTIRALGILISILSARSSAGSGPAFIGIEEPETALHPAAAGALMDALIEGARRTQLIISCHSPDLLEHSSVTAEMIRAVILADGSTSVGKLDPRKVELLRQHLTSAGELLRMDQLEPDPEDIKRQVEAAGTLWAGTN